ncbi:conserved exported protein of unknown function [Sterolibacterium denitrificans]|uniref:DUF3617 domain-containing protein n=1 Tax=Sterolibacterium denitrificans TaxID=157592 RepID=A0A7Z7MUI2_9PROT|nr:DUF3617 domain-containing protein [Sterolibacterium denitrificans]SMB22606.1 conserved exported protein of unknown function [Sterolibacterium denitrificans]
MKTPLIQLLALLMLAGIGSVGGVGSAHAQGVQPGLWEFSHDMKMPGQPDMNARMAQMREQLKNLPPEARRMMEQQMSGMGVGIGEGGALRMCITPEDARDDFIREGRTEGDCTFTQVKRSGNTWRGRIVCKASASQGDFTTTLHGPTHFSTVANMTSKQHGRVDMKSEARRVSGDCGTLGKAAARPR